MADTESRAVFKNLDRIIYAALGLLVLVYIASGVFVVEADEKAVLFRFGRASEVITPGIGYHWPWPVEWVRKVNVKQVKTLEAGFYPGAAGSEALLSYCITGDKNIIHNRYKIQYRIGDPANFITVSRNAQDIMFDLAQATIIEEVAEREVDPLLTTGKSEMERAIFEGLNQRLAELNLKLQIVGVERQSARPPNLVRDAFQDVVNAREEKRTQVHEAENYRNQEIPKAKGEADSLLQNARAYKFEKVSSAKGESQRFLDLYEQYRNAAGVTRHRLLIETVEQVLPNTKVVVLAKDRQGKPIRIKLMQAPVPTSPRLPE